MDLIGYGDRTLLLTPGSNRPGNKLTGFDAFVIHGTANPARGANAVMHYRYWMPGGAGRTVSSVHFVADENEVIQLLPINEVGWHVGRGALASGAQPGYRTVAIELCENQGSDYAETARRAALVVAKVLFAYRKPVVDGVTIRRHGSFCPPYTTHCSCPAWMGQGRAGITWAKFVSMVRAEYAKLQGGSPADERDPLLFNFPARVSLNTFQDVLVRGGSPAASAAPALYSICTQAGIDPGVALGFFHHESSLGTAGITKDFQTFNWGNVRTPVDSQYPVIDTPRGQFAKYPTWEAGLTDWGRRINERYVRDRGLDTVEEAIPVYAPSSDGNNVQAYVDAIQTDIARWQDEDTRRMRVRGDRSAACYADVTNSSQRLGTLEPGAWIYVDAVRGDGQILGDDRGPNSGTWVHAGAPVAGWLPTVDLDPFAWQFSVIAADGANIRQGPATTHPVAAVLNTGDVIVVRQIVLGENVGGERRWAHLADQRGFVHLSLLDPKG